MQQVGIPSSNIFQFLPYVKHDVFFLIKMLSATLLYPNFEHTIDLTAKKICGLLIWYFSIAVKFGKTYMGLLDSVHTDL